MTKRLDNFLLTSSYLLRDARYSYTLLKACFFLLLFSYKYYQCQSFSGSYFMIGLKKTFINLAVSSVPYGPSMLIILLKVPDGRTDRRTDGPTDGQTLLQRCEDASKNYGSFVNGFEFVSNLDQPGLCTVADEERPVKRMKL